MDQEIIEDALALGASDEDIARLARMRPPEDFQVLPENWPALRLFLAMQTQWRAAAMGGLIGLDYGVLDGVARLSGIVLDEDVFARLRILEMAALEVVNRPRHEHRSHSRNTSAGRRL